MAQSRSRYGRVQRSRGGQTGCRGTTSVWWHRHPIGSIGRVRTAAAVRGRVADPAGVARAKRRRDVRLWRSAVVCASRSSWRSTSILTYESSSSSELEPAAVLPASAPPAPSLAGGGTPGLAAVDGDKDAAAVPPRPEDTKLWHAAASNGTLRRAAARPEEARSTKIGPYPSYSVASSSSEATISVRGWRRPDATRLTNCTSGSSHLGK